jgi:predicted RNase H-like HicB family nuclease
MRLSYALGMKTFTAIIRKDEDYYVALCPEIDVVSQGKTVDKALKNLKEAVELYIEEMGLPEGYDDNETIIARFTVVEDAKVA